MQTVTIRKKASRLERKKFNIRKLDFKTRNIINDKEAHCIMKSTQDVFHGRSMYQEDKKCTDVYEPKNSTSKYSKEKWTKLQEKID